MDIATKKQIASLDRSTTKQLQERFRELFGYETRARMTQIMRLLDLAQDIQEEILFDQPAVTERDVRLVTRPVDWAAQRCAWRQLVSPPDLS